MVKKTVIGIVIALVLIIIIAGMSGGDKKETNQTVKKETTSTQQKADLGKEVQDAYLKQLGYASISELNLDDQNLVGSQEQSIVSFTDKGSGQVQVEVQDNLTKPQATAIAQSIMSSASDVEGLKTVFVHSLNGTLSYVNK